MDLHGLQLASTTLSTLSNFSTYSFFDARTSTWSPHPHEPEMPDQDAVYLSGTFTSGSIFFSPYFRTFLLVYMNHHADNKIYIRYLDPRRPRTPPLPFQAASPPPQQPPTSLPTGAASAPPLPHLDPEDLSALTLYTWSPPQVLHHTPANPSPSSSPSTTETFNYAGQAHPEFFNRQYYPPSFRAASPWLGGAVSSSSSSEEEKADERVDGKHLLLSWTTTTPAGYDIQLAKVEFAGLPEEIGFWNLGVGDGDGDGDGGGNGDGEGETGKKSGAGRTCGAGLAVGWKRLFLLPLWLGAVLFPGLV